ncbi:MAG: NDP-sugar synthase [Candidatus Saganbacteria bacterium]|nr:NDP-sugar synthase [Candidatus Saganbacteria bacterium]
MKALIMAAGYGTRLEPLTLAAPKPMVPVVNKPTMLHNLELLRKYGIKEMIANIHYFPEQIQNYFLDGKDFGVKLSYSYEEELLGTAGGVKRMARLIGIDGTFVVLSSDALTDINLNKLIAYHKKKKALATISLYKVEDPSYFGVVALDESGRIGFFQEKPKKEEAISNLVNAGIYVFEPEILDMIPDGFFDFGKELFPRLISEKAPIFGYEMVEYWSDVGSLEQYKQANIDAMQGRARLSIPGRGIASETFVGENAHIDDSARFEGPVVIGREVKIGKGVKIMGPSVIGDRCVIGEETLISESMIWPDTRIGKAAKIEKSIVGSFCDISESVHIRDSVISNRCRIGKRKNLTSVKIIPDKSI